MKSLAMTIPDEPAELADWLEQQLVSPEFGHLLVELEEIFVESINPRPIQAKLNELENEILKSGLKKVSPDLLGDLISHPKLLSEWQEKILIKGGAYWDQKFIPQQETDVINRVREKLFPGITPSTRPLVKIASTTSANKTNTPSKAKWFALAASVAIVGFAIVWGAFIREDDRLSEWGWATLPAPVERMGMDEPTAEERTQYLELLATRARDWYETRPGNSKQLLKRIDEFRMNCEKLIAMEHPSLPQKDQVWLRERCQIWLGKLNDQRTKLTSGEATEVIQKEVDGIVDQLVNALNTRAKMPA
jgi:hypothetical protein